MKKIIIILAVILTSGVTAWAINNNSAKSTTEKVNVVVSKSTNLTANLGTAD